MTIIKTLLPDCMKYFILITIVLLFFNTCTKEQEIDDQINTLPTLPTVTTTSLTSVTTSTAQLGGIVVNDGGEVITAHGICWSTNLNPTISDNKTIDGAGTGTPKQRRALSTVRPELFGCDLHPQQGQHASLRQSDRRTGSRVHTGGGCRGCHLLQHPS